MCAKVDRTKGRDRHLKFEVAEGFWLDQRADHCWRPVSGLIFASTRCRCRSRPYDDV